MKKKLLLASVAALSLASAVAMASVNIKQTDTGGMVWQFISGSAETDAWNWSALGILDFTPATTAVNSATTNDMAEIAYTTPVDTTGTNTHNALTIDLAIGNATGGTNAAVGLQVDAITGDAQVTETAINIGSGWDAGITSASPLSLSSTTSTTGDVSILTPGDLIVGAGTPTVAQNGEDAYVTGTFEVDGAVRFDSTLLVTGAGGLTLGNSDSVHTDTDATFDFTRNTAGTVSITASDDDATAALTILPGGAAAMTVGGSSTTAVTVTTDGTGTGEVVLPAGSVSGTEVTDATLLPADDLYPHRGRFSVCGDATTVNANTIYYGPSQVLVTSATVGLARKCDTTATGSATEATADEPAYVATAFQVIGLDCINADSGVTLTFTTRSAAAATTPSIVASIADNILQGSGTGGPTTTAIASGATFAIGVASASDVATANVPFVCTVDVAY